MKKIGLVFGGGGGRGSYQIGVWKAIKELGLENRIAAIAGTSVGGLNAVLFAQGDYEIAQAVWLNITHEKILSPDMQKLFSLFVASLGGVGPFNIPVIQTVTHEGIFSQRGLMQIIRENLDPQKMVQNSRDCYLASFNTSTKRSDYLNIKGKPLRYIETALLATSALPVVFGSVPLDGALYRDGFLGGSNIPIEPLCNPTYGAVCDVLITVPLQSKDLSAVPWRYCRYGKIISIIPTKDLGNFFTGTLDFSSANVPWRIELGYKDARKILEATIRSGILT